MLFQDWPDKKDRFMSVSEAANALGGIKEDIHTLVDEGLLTPIKHLPGDFRYLISMRELNRLMNN